MRRLVLFLAAASLLAGCATTVTGTPRAVPTTATASVAAPVRHLDPDHVTAGDALGDLTTVSPCSMIPITVLPTGYGPADILSSGNIDTCEIYSATKDGGIYATVGILEAYSTASASGVKKFLPRAGGMRIAVQADDAKGCAALLLFADNVTLAAQVWPAQKKAKNMCALATALLDHVIKVATGKGPRHRDYPAESLAHEDACRLLTASAAELVADAGVMSKIANYPAHHRCIYEGSVSRRVQVSLDFGVYDPAHDDVGLTPKTIAGRDSLVDGDANPGGSSAYCDVFTLGKPIQDAGPGAPQETADVLVRVPAGDKPPCADAERVTAAVWKKLP